MLPPSAPKCCASLCWQVLLLLLPCLGFSVRSAERSVERHEGNVSVPGSLPSKSSLRDSWAGPQAKQLLLHPKVAQNQQKVTPIRNTNFEDQRAGIHNYQYHFEVCTLKYGLLAFQILFPKSRNGARDEPRHKCTSECQVCTRSWT